MIIAGNFKTNHTRASTKEYIEILNKFMYVNSIKDEVYIFPSFTAIDNFKTNAKVGVQNAYPTDSGSFTGEVGYLQLREFDINTILIGHSERRHILGESNELIQEKFNFFKEKNFIIFYCVGEPLEVRKQGLDEVLKYIDNQLIGIDLNYENLIIAYEPVWAIGTGVSATNREIKETHLALKKRFFKPLLYGGSVKASSVKEILEIDEVDGVLIGTASWKIEDFNKILEISKEI